MRGAVTTQFPQRSYPLAVAGASVGASCDAATQPSVIDLTSDVRLVCAPPEGPRGSVVGSRVHV